MAGRIRGPQLENATVTETQLATSVAGGGITGGAGTPLAVQTGDGVEVDSDRVKTQVSTATLAQQYGGLVRTRNADGSGAGTTDDGYMAVQTDNSTVQVNASNQVSVPNGGITETQLNASVAGDGLAGGGGTALSVNVGAGVEIAADTVRLSTQGNGIAGGAGTTLSIDDDSTVTFVSPVAWTFPNGVTAEGLFVTGTMVDANHVTNKAYVDSKVSGLEWRQPVDVKELVGNLGETALEALSPTDGDAYVVSAVDGDGVLNPGAVTGLAVGDLVEFANSIWSRIAAGAGGFVADGIRAILSAQTPLIAPYTDGADDNNVVEFDGTSLTGTTTSDATDGASVFVQGEGGFFENNGYVLDLDGGAVAAGTWIQFTGAGQINAGTGISKTGNTINVGDAGRAVQVNADTLEFDASEASFSTGGLEASSNSWQLQLKTHAGADGVAVSTDANGVNIDGDLVNIDQVPTNYTRSTAGTGVDVADLASHLQGLDDFAGAIKKSPSDIDKSPAAVSTDATTTTLTITDIVKGMVNVFVNGVQALVGNGTITGADCAFTDDNGTTYKAHGAAAQGDTLFWNGASCYALLATDDVTFDYLTTT